LKHTSAETTCEFFSGKGHVEVTIHAIRQATKLNQVSGSTNVACLNKPNVKHIERSAPTDKSQATAILKTRYATLRAKLCRVA
jgi:hypothetical protein